MWRCFLPRRGCWVVVKSPWLRPVCTYCCCSLQLASITAVRIPMRSRRRSLLVLAPSQVMQVACLRGSACHRDCGEGGSGGGENKSGKSDIRVSEEGNQSFEKVCSHVDTTYPPLMEGTLCKNGCFTLWLGEYLDDSKCTFTVENSPVSSFRLPGELLEQGRG